MNIRISLWLAVVLIVLAAYLGKLHEKRAHELD